MRIFKKYKKKTTSKLDEKGILLMNLRIA